MFAGRVGSRHWVVPALLILAVVFAAALAYNLGNLDTGGEALPDVPNPGGPPASSGGFVGMDPIATLVLLMILGGLIAIVLYAMRRMRNRESEDIRKAGWLDLAASLMGVLYFAALVVAWPHLVVLLAWIVAAIVGAPESVDPGNGDGAGTAVALPTVSGISAGVFLAGTLLVAALLVMYLRQRREPEGAVLDAPFEGFGMRREAAEALRRTIEELELGGDVRGAIQACFQRFCALLAGRGIEDQNARTPRELSAVAVERLRVSTEAADSLTSLFEEARYSVHPLDESDRDRAVASLEQLRSALEA